MKVMAMTVNGTLARRDAAFASLMSRVVSETYGK